jgi:PPOX class probable F420-dependent enzyme
MRRIRARDILDPMNVSQLLHPRRPAAGLDRLRTATTIWVGTVDSNGRPHLVPTWFSWDGEAVWIYSKREAVKVRNVRHERRVTLALGEPEDDFDVQLIEAVAELPPEPTAELIGEVHWRKYGRRLRSLGISADEYVATYSQPIRVRPTRFLPWHGRGPRWTPRARPMPTLAPPPALRLALR